MPGSPEGQPRLDNWKAENEADKLRQKVESGEAVSYEGAEQLVRLESLKRIQQKIEIMASAPKANDVVELRHIASFLRSQGLVTLSEVCEEAIPLAGAESVKFVLSALGSEPSKRGINAAHAIVGHKTRKAVYGQDKSQLKVALNAFLADEALAIGQFELAREYYEDIEDGEKIKEIDEIMKSYRRRGLEHRTDLDYKTVDEQYFGIQQSAQRFFDKIEGFEEVKTSYQEALRKLLDRLSAELESEKHKEPS